MQIELPPAPVFKKGFECVCHRPGRLFHPKESVLRSSGPLQGFLARFEVQVEDASSPVDHVDLTDVGKTRMRDIGLSSTREPPRESPGWRPLLQVSLFSMKPAGSVQQP